MHSRGSEIEARRTPLYATVTREAIKKGKSVNGKRFPPKKGDVSEESSQGRGSKFTVKCYFCGKKEHVIKDCSKCKAWFEKRGINLSFVCYKSNLAEVPSNT